MSALGGAKVEDGAPADGASLAANPVKHGAGAAAKVVAPSLSVRGAAGARDGLAGDEMATPAGTDADAMVAVTQSDGFVLGWERGILRTPIFPCTGVNVPKLPDVLTTASGSRFCSVAIPVCGGSCSGLSRLERSRVS